MPRRLRLPFTKPRPLNQKGSSSTTVQAARSFLRVSVAFLASPPASERARSQSRETVAVKRKRPLPRKRTSPTEQSRRQSSRASPPS